MSAPTRAVRRLEPPDLVVGATYSGRLGPDRTVLAVLPARQYGNRRPLISYEVTYRDGRTVRMMCEDLSFAHWVTIPGPKP